MPPEHKKHHLHSHHYQQHPTKRLKGRLKGSITRRKMLKMLAVMEPQETTSTTSAAANSHSQEFLTTGRTGRRNALPDILSEHAVVSSGDLPERLQNLSTSDGASTSSAAGCSSSSEASTSKDSAATGS